MNLFLFGGLPIADKTLFCPMRSSHCVTATLTGLLRGGGCLMRLNVAAVCLSLCLIGVSSADDGVDQGRSSGALSVESQASDSKDNSNNPATGLEEITVTATKRRENLQDIPFGISALSTADLEKVGAESEQDYLAEVPGVHYTDAGRGRSLLTIRGISTVGLPGNLQQTVEVYVDELPITDRFSAWTSPDISAFDIERVEVLRGPQGTLFGSGALGGAVRLITSKPDTTAFHTKIEVGGATTNGAGSDAFKAMVNAPLIEDKLALRVVAFRTDQGGWVDNVRRHQHDVNGGYNEGGRAMLEFTPTDALKLRATVLNERDSLDDSSKTFSFSSDGPANQWDGVIPESSLSKLSIYNFTGEYDAGFATLTSVSTYEQRKSYLATDYVRYFTTTPDPNNDSFYITHDSTKSSQEVRLSSNGQTNLEWTIGGFFLHTQQNLLQIWRLGPTHIDEETLYIPTVTREGAAFGEATYHITRKVSVTAGARWFDNSFDQATVYEPGSILQGGHGLVTIHSSATTPKFSASYYPKENVHLYVTASKGYRVGQVNFNAGISPVVPNGFGPDSLWNYEVGIKANWFDNRLLTNVSAYHIDWTNIQLGRFVGNFYYTDNAGKAKSNGVEAEFVAQPIEAINLGSSITFTDATLTSAAPGTGLTSGSTLPGSSRWSASNYAQATTHFEDDVSGYIRLSHQYVSKVYGYIVNSPFVASDPYNKFDLRAGIVHGHYEFVAYVDNLTNNDAAVTRVNTPPYDPAYRLRPRTVGVTFRASY